LQRLRNNAKLQHTAAHRNSLLHRDLNSIENSTLPDAATCCNVATLQHTAAHRLELHRGRRTATYCKAQQHAATRRTEPHREQHTATHCNTLQHAATRCDILQHTTANRPEQHREHHTATHCNTLQHPARYCNTLQRTDLSSIENSIITSGDSIDCKTFACLTRVPYNMHKTAHDTQHTPHT